MANLTSAINVNVPTDVKEEATSLFNSLGLNMSTAINMFLKKAIYERGIPFEVKQKPSKELIEALKELDYMEEHPEEYKVYHNVDKMFEDILDE
jgi:DNA-damage-inducible protein J